MRTTVILATIMLMPFCLFAQGSPVDRLFEKYSGREGYTSVYISRHMFRLFANLEPENKEFEEVFGKLTGIRILASDQKSPAGVNFFNEIMADLPAGEYEELMVVRERDQDFKFLIKEKNGLISELLMVAGGATNNALISIQGNIDLNTIARISKSMNLEGLDALQKIE
ncbi:MAG: DUF4252 domain-containing protein [Marinilabiliales bacterium]|nr:MAG: DUF4252 domain-containing protein [Marinilabiliales bacterium]